MEAYTNYEIVLKGNSESIEKATMVLAKAFDDETIINNDHISIEQTQAVVWIDDAEKLVQKVIKNTSGLEMISVSGTVDASFGDGTYQDFQMLYEGECLTVRTTGWYTPFMICDEFPDYEMFCETFCNEDGEPCYTEEEYEEFVANEEMTYGINSSEGYVVKNEPEFLHEKQIEIKK